MSFRSAVNAPQSLGSLNAVTTTQGASGNTAVEFAVPERRTISITGTFVGTISFEGSVNGVDWFGVGAVPAAGGAEVVSATAAGLWTIMRVPPAFRVKCTAYTSGAAVVQTADLA
jgi:hypothetical protein